MSDLVGVIILTIMLCLLWNPSEVGELVKKIEIGFMQGYNKEVKQ